MKFGIISAVDLWNLTFESSTFAGNLVSDEAYAIYASRSAMLYHRPSDVTKGNKLSS